jgi:division protein CdvB (Snf7/Vps24/ESCRT-III family)
VPGPLKTRLDVDIRHLELQVKKLDDAKDRFEERDKVIFARIVNACTKHDTIRGLVFANELAEIRKMQRQIVIARLTLERKILRLRTISILGEIVSTLGPKISRVLIDNLPSSILEEPPQHSGMKLDFETMNKDAYRILAEATIVAEQGIKENFLDLPSIPTAISNNGTL